MIVLLVCMRAHNNTYCAYCVFFVNIAGMSYVYGDFKRRRSKEIPINSRINLMKKSAFPDIFFVYEC